MYLLPRARHAPETWGGGCCDVVGFEDQSELVTLRYHALNGDTHVMMYKV